MNLLGESAYNHNPHGGIRRDEPGQQLFGQLVLNSFRQSEKYRKFKMIQTYPIEATSDESKDVSESSFVKIPKVGVCKRTLSGVACSRVQQVPSYPTGSLDFLFKEEQSKGLCAHSRISLKFIVVGAGLGGLAAAISLARRGHQVTVFEQAPILGEVSTFGS